MSSKLCIIYKLC